MPQYHWELEQGTEEWLEVRRGILTASNTHSLLTPTFKIAKNDKVRELAYELAAQRITGRIEDQVETFHTRRGHEEEPIAIALYDGTVKPCGFIRNGCFGYSPDGVVGDDGLIEVKSKIQKNQLKTIIADKMPDEHMIQCQDGMLVSEREWCDFIQYSNGMPLFVERIYRDEEMIKLIEQVKLEFEEKIVELVEQYKENANKYKMAEYRTESVEDFDI